MDMIGRRQVLAGLGMMATSPALAQIQPAAPSTIRPILQRRARTIKLFKAPEFYPNALAIPEQGDAGVFIAQQKLKGIQAKGAGVPEQKGPEQVWLMDWNGKVQKTYSSASEVTSALAVSDTSLYVISNNETDYPPPYTGVHNLDIKTGRTRWVKQIPLGGGGTHGAQWHDGKLWIIASRLNCILRIDADSWICDHAIRIHNDTPDTMRTHDMTFDDQGFLWLATANLSKSYAQGIQGLSKYDPKTGNVLEQVTLEPGSCDPHGLGFYKGAFIGCDAGHHPGWPDKDGPGAGWIFRIELI
jgi:hypothetical protein